MLEAAHENDIELEGKDSNAYLVQYFAPLPQPNLVLLQLMSSEVMVLMKVISYNLGIFVTIAVLLKDVLTVWITYHM